MKTQVSFVRGEESDTGGGVAEILVTVDDSLLSSVFLPLHPLDRELSGPSLSCGCKAAGQSGCLSVTCVCACPSALVSIVVVHGGWAAGHYRGASSRCKVTCNSWTYRWQEDGDGSVQVWLGGRAGVLVVSYNGSVLVFAQLLVTYHKCSRIQGCSRMGDWKGFWIWNNVIEGV